jgi:acyl carrier protein
MRSVTETEREETVMPPTDDVLLAKLDEIFQDVLEDDELKLSPETTAKDVDNWDSLNHVRLMLTVEKSFGVKFSASEIGRLKNIGGLIKLVKDKLPQ